MWLKPKFDQFINCWRSVINVPKFSTTEKQVRWVRTYVVTFGNFMSFCNINSGWKRVVWFFDEKIYLFIHGLVNLSNFRDYILLPKTFFIKFFFVKINFSSKIISDEKRNSVYNFWRKNTKISTKKVFDRIIFWRKNFFLDLMVHLQAQIKTSITKYCDNELSWVW